LSASSLHNTVHAMTEKLSKTKTVEEDLDVKRPSDRNVRQTAEFNESQPTAWNSACSLSACKRTKGRKSV
jgi:hypothetical protein